MAYPYQTIYLASASPRRRELLKQIGVRFEVLLLRTQPARAEVDETPILGEAPRDYVVRLARAKAEAGSMACRSRHLPAYPVLAADTTVTLDGAIIGKPANRAEAEATLARLAGRRHEVLSAVAIAFDGRLEVKLSASCVEFAPLDASAIKRYVASGESHDKAGAYAIQGRAAAFVTRLEGSYSGVMGLPLSETSQLLQKFGIEVI
ncbi:MAG: Maf family protein [Sulfurimicrobium sp.]|jgi:septum formation protein|nr:Maf family protein [Sulfurimicrobium sp.]MDP1896882.1 Maf family protein [Sulfurimicrobium sp.]MDP2963640.1 Maf family protein [Sulfurimicrobium sp.]MDZ7657442.1 Maf family protein [Sulfurimicrobium sp.]